MSSSNVSTRCIVLDNLYDVVERSVDLHDMLGIGATDDDFC